MSGELTVESGAVTRKPQWAWLRTRRGIALCPRCFALVPPNRRVDHEDWHLTRRPVSSTPEEG